MLFNFDLLFSLLYQRLVIDMLVYIFSYVIVEIVFIYHSDNLFCAFSLLIFFDFFFSSSNVVVQI